MFQHLRHRGKAPTHTLPAGSRTRQLPQLLQLRVHPALGPHAAHRLTHAPASPAAAAARAPRPWAHTLLIGSRTHQLPQLLQLSQAHARTSFSSCCSCACTAADSACTA